MTTVLELSFPTWDGLIMAWTLSQCVSSNDWKICLVFSQLAIYTCIYPQTTLCWGGAMKFWLTEILFFSLFKKLRYYMYFIAWYIFVKCGNVFSLKAPEFCIHAQVLFEPHIGSVWLCKPRIKSYITTFTNCLCNTCNLKSVYGIAKIIAEQFCVTLQFRETIYRYQALTLYMHVQFTSTQHS